VTKDRFTEQFIAASEVPKERHLINASLSSDFPSGSPLKTIAGKHPLGGFKDALASEFAIRTSTRRRICLVWINDASIYLHFALDATANFTISGFVGPRQVPARVAAKDESKGLMEPMENDGR
jgi:hypothetical protein